MKPRSEYKQNGFTIIELLVVMMLCFLVLFVPVTICSNEWYTADGVLRELRVYNSEIVRIVEIKPHTFFYSQIEVENQDGSHSFYLLNSNVLYNYRLYSYKPR